MTFPEFDFYQSSLLSEAQGMNLTKGKEYAHDADRFANFNRLSTELGISNILVAWIFTKKHLDSIASYVKEGKEFSSEGIRGRLVDAITYLTLIGGMIEEKSNIDSRVKPQEVTSSLDNATCNYCEKKFQSGDSAIKNADGFAHFHCWQNSSL